MFRTKVVEKITTHLLCSITIFENRAVYEKMWKHSTPGQTTDENIAHAHCVIDIKGYKHTLTVCNTYCFPLQQILN